MPTTGHVVTTHGEEMGYSYVSSSGGNSTYNISRAKHGTTASAISVGVGNMAGVVSETAACSTCGVLMQTVNAGGTTFGEQTNAGLEPSVGGDYAVFNAITIPTLNTHPSEFLEASPTANGAVTPSGYSAGSFDASGAAAARQAAYTNLTSIGSLANAAGWLHNDGAGAFAYSTPTAANVGAEPALGNPGTNGYLLSSTTLGVRSWIAPYSYTLPTATSSILGGVKPDGTSILNTAGAISATYTSVGADASGAAAARAAVGSCSAGQYGTATTTSGLTCAQVAYSQVSGTPSIPSVGTWGALNYPTWASGTPFVKMTAAGTFALDTTAFLPLTGGTLSGGILGGQTFNGLTLSLGANSIASNVAVGSNALSSGSLSGTYNTANGYFSLYSNTTGQSNTANGVFSLYSNTTGQNNTTNGFESLTKNTTGQGNTANGNSSLYSNTTGTYNTANGFGSLYTNTTSSNSVALGAYAGYNSTIPNAFYVGNRQQSTAANDQNYSLLYGNFAGTAGTTTGQFLQINGNEYVMNGNVSIGDTTAAAMFNVGTANQFQVSSTGVSSAGAGSTDYSTASSAQVAHCLADGTGGGACGGSIPLTTVSGLPTEGIPVGDLYLVGDGTTNTDCATGGGSPGIDVLCRFNGSTWVAYSAFANPAYSPTNHFTSNAFGVCYTNGLGLLVHVHITTLSSPADTTTIYVGNSCSPSPSTPAAAQSQVGGSGEVSADIPPGVSYKATNDGSGTLVTWLEVY